jgi:hypothetical protein
VFMYHVLFLWRGGYQYSHDWGVRRLVSTKKIVDFQGIWSMLLYQRIWNRLK